MWILPIFFTRPFKAGWLWLRSQSESPTNLKVGGLSSSSLGQDTPSWPQLVCVTVRSKGQMHRKGCVCISVVSVSAVPLYVCLHRCTQSCQSHSDHQRALCTFAPDFILIIIIILTWIMHHCIFIVYLQHRCADWICAQMNRVVKMRRMCILALAEHELLYQHNKDTRYCRFTA